MAAPVLSSNQRRAGHAASLELRQQRAAIKYDLANGFTSLNDALEQPAVAGMKVRKLLQCLPYIGPARAESLLEVAGIPAGSSVRAIGPRQREALLAALARRR